MSAPPKAGAGKKWEQMVGRALKHAGVPYRYNRNSPTPGTDWHCCHNSTSIMVECKETEMDEMRFDYISDAEHDHLTNHANAGGLTLVLVSRVGSNWRRAWACHWSSWLALERTLGRPSTRKKAANGKFSLCPPPSCFMELEREDRHGIETWVLAPVLLATHATGLVATEADDGLEFEFDMEDLFTS